MGDSDFQPSGAPKPLNRLEYNVVAKMMHLHFTRSQSDQSINQSFICSEQHKKKSEYTIQCRTGHKGMKHLQVPLTKPNNKNTKMMTVY